MALLFLADTTSAVPMLSMTVTYEGDPSGVSSPTIVKNANVGSLYREASNERMWWKQSTGWVAFVPGRESVSKVGTPANNQLAVWTGDGTLEGESKLTFDGTMLLVQHASAPAQVRLVPTTANAADSSVVYLLENDQNSGAFLRYDGSLNELEIGCRSGGTDYDGLVMDQATRAITISGDVTISKATPSLIMKVPIADVGAMWIQGPNASGSLTRTMSGLQLSSLTSAPTSYIYTPAIKFMSTDTSFTTENPKLLAAIAGRATEEYAADTDGGMAIDFFATADNPGATSVPTRIMSVQSTHVWLNAVPLAFESGATTKIWKSGGNDMVFTTSIGGDRYLSTLVNSSGTPVDNQIAIFTDANTVEGSSELTWDATTLKISNGSSSHTPGVDYDELFLESAGNTGMTIAGGTTSYATVAFADSGGTRGWMQYAFNTEAMELGANATAAMTILGLTGRVGIGATGPNARLEVATGSSEATEALRLSQADTDMPFINYAGTEGADSTSSISTYTTPGSVTGFVQIYINGAKRWIPFYTSISA